MEWKDIEQTPNFQINALGQIRNRLTGKIRKTKISSAGYERVNIYIGKKCHSLDVHRVLAENFIPNPDNLPQVDHIDNNRLNNVLSNLRWVTMQENLANREICNTGITFNEFSQKWHVKIRGKKAEKVFADIDDAVVYLKSQTIKMTVAA